MTELATRNLTILLTDIKGFTDKTSRKSRGEILEMLERHKAVVLPILEGRGGKLIKTIGDAFLMVFESPTDAVLSGVAVQEALREHNKDKADDDRLDVRVAINTGEVNLADNDIFGEPVNITARIEAVAEAGEVFFTEAVYLSMNKKEVPSSEVGLLQLKGIPEKVRVYKVKREEPVRQISAVHGAVEGAGRVVGSVAAAVGAAAGMAPAQSSASTISRKTRASVSRRSVALLIDVCLCGILVGMVFSSRGSHHRRRSDAAVKAAVADGLAQAAKAAATGNVKIDDNGIHVDSKLGKVALDDNGVRVSGGGRQLTIDDNGVSVKDARGTRVIAKAGDDDGDTDDEGGGRWRWAWPLSWFLYGLISLKWLGGTTAGGKIMKVGVVRADGSPLDKRERMVRSAFSVVSGYCAGLGYLWGLWEKDGRGWHDLMAGTRVVSLD